MPLPGIPDGFYVCPDEHPVTDRYSYVCPECGGIVVYVPLAALLDVRDENRELREKLRDVRPETPEAEVSG